MSILFLILLVAVLYYLIIKPLLRVYFSYKKLRNGDISALFDLFGQPGSQRHRSAYEPDGRRKAGWSHPTPPNKKIADDVGEYVKFTEVTVTETTTASDPASGSTATFTTEQQVTDVEWEDIK